MSSELGFELEDVTVWFACPVCRSYFHSVPAVTDHSKTVHNVEYVPCDHLPPGAAEGKIFFDYVDSESDEDDEEGDSSGSEEEGVSGESDEEGVSGESDEEGDSSESDDDGEEEDDNQQSLDSPPTPCNIRIKNFNELMDCSSGSDKMAEAIDKNNEEAGPITSPPDSGIIDGGSEIHEDEGHQHRTIIPRTVTSTATTEPVAESSQKGDCPSNEASKSQSRRTENSVPSTPKNKAIIIKQRDSEMREANLAKDGRPKKGHVVDESVERHNESGSSSCSTDDTVRIHRPDNGNLRENSPTADGNQKSPSSSDWSPPRTRASSSNSTSKSSASKSSASKSSASISAGRTPKISKRSSRRNAPSGDSDSTSDESPRKPPRKRARRRILASEKAEDSSSNNPGDSDWEPPKSKNDSFIERDTPTPSRSSDSASGEEDNLSTKSSSESSPRKTKRKRSKSESDASSSSSSKSSQSKNTSTSADKDSEGHLTDKKTTTEDEMPTAQEDQSKKKASSTNTDSDDLFIPIGKVKKRKKKKDLDKLAKKTDPSRPRSNTTCTKCGMECEDTRAFIEHMQEFHIKTGEKLTLTCGYCKKKYTNRHHFNNHIQTHKKPTSSSES